LRVWKKWRCVVLLCQLHSVRSSNCIKAIIKEDLELFKDIMDHRESSKLEWIIIALILLEVVDLFVFRLF